MSTEVLYRKWRPRRFSDVAGQDPITRTLRNAVATGKVAHAYLFAGPRGTGKTSTGRILAKAVNCLDPQDGEPCDACRSCQDFNDGRAMDLIELDAASNRGIDEVRSIRDKAGFAPTSSQFKVYLVDEVHMLTEFAANALLKTLEEPPPHTIFVLATTEANRLPDTIISRCQRFDFRRIPLQAVVDRLAYISEQEGYEADLAALETIARTATGSLRDGVNLLDQVIAYRGRSLTVEGVQAGLGLLADSRATNLVQAVLEGDFAASLSILSAVRDDGVDLRLFQRETVSLLRQMLLIKSGASDDVGLPADKQSELSSLLRNVTAEAIVRALRSIAGADLRADPHSPVPLELAVAELLVLGTAADRMRPNPSAPQGSRQSPPTTAPPPPVRQNTLTATPKPVSAPAPTESPPVEPERAVATVAREPVTIEPASSVAEPTSGELEEFRQRWPELYRVTKGFSMKAGAFLNSGCDIMSIDGTTIVFGFKHSMHLDKMVSGDGGANLDALQKAVDKVIGPGWTVRCEHYPDLTDRPVRSGAPAKSSLVEMAQNAGAKIVNRK